jgi:hypothetical protein
VGSAAAGGAGGAEVAATAAFSSSVLGFLRGRPRFAGGLFFFASSAASSSGVRICWSSSDAETRRKAREGDSEHQVAQDEALTRLGSALLTFRGRPLPRFTGWAGASPVEVPAGAAAPSAVAAGAGALGSAAGKAAVSPAAVSGFFFEGRPRFLGGDLSSTCRERRGSVVRHWENCRGREEPGRC